MTQAFDMEALTAPAAQVQEYLRDYLHARALPGNLEDAIEYALLGGGKMLRPILVVRACEAVGGKLANALPAAAALEMVHCFSLAHDDLPAMDDDDMRRGRPSLHKHTSETLAILAGDGMMALAFELIAERVSEPSLCSTLVRELAIGTNDMIAGQVYDTLPDFPEDIEPMDRLVTVHKNKTGALLRAACRMGAISGGAGAAELNALSQYACSIGLMFQAVDDLLDVTQTSEQLGKEAGKDAEQGKLTYPGLLGIEGTREEISRLQAEAHEALDTLDEALADRDANADTELLRGLCDYMAVRQK